MHASQIICLILMNFNLLHWNILVLLRTKCILLMNFLFDLYGEFKANESNVYKIPSNIFKISKTKFAKKLSNLV